MNMQTLRGLVAGVLWGLCLPEAEHAGAEPLELHIDADFSLTAAGPRAISLGVATALAEADFKAGGQELVIVERNHRSNARRSQRHLRAFKRLLASCVVTT